jgi:hypothetical protein
VAYACPVCDSLAPDGEHLAHHLAIVAMSRGGEHETWLDEHADGWREESPETLATFALEHAEEVDHELADATAGDRPDAGHDHGGAGAHDHGHAHGTGAQGGAGGSGGGNAAGRGSTGASVASDEETQAVLAEAREITQRMLDDDGGEEERESGDSGDREADDASAETDTDE